MILPRRRKRDSFLPWVQLAVDGLAIQLILQAVFWFRFSSGFFEASLAVPDYSVYTHSFGFITLALIFFFRLYGLYKPTKQLTFSDEAWKVVKGVSASVVALMAITFFIRDFSFSRTFLILAGGVMAIGISLSRFLLGLLVMAVDQKRGSTHNILILGCDENARKIARFYKKNPRFSTRVAGFLDDKLPGGTSVDDAPVLGRIEELSQQLQIRREIHEVILAAQGYSDEMILKIIYECEKKMVVFRWISDIFGLIASKMNVAYRGGIPLLSFMDSPLGDWENRVLKRGMDMVLSAAAIVFLSPVFLAIAVLVKADSKGPLFYRQRRIGEDGRRFRLIKFRTMRADAEKETGAVWAKENDSRRTRIGGFLRRNNLDELPQIWNVLAGDMSLVGPRPERPFFVRRFKEDIPRYMARHSIKSGLTGWAQVNGLRGNTSIEERTKFDLYYIENWSIFFDLRIMFMTLFAMMLKKTRNAY